MIQNEIEYQVGRLTTVDVRNLLDSSDIQIEVVSEAHPVGERHTATVVEVTFDIFKFRDKLFELLTRE